MHEEKHIQKLQLDFLKITIHVFFYFIIKEARTIFQKIVITTTKLFAKTKKARCI